MQLITTREPDDDMIRVGIASVEAVFDWQAYLEREFRYSPESTGTGENGAGAPAAGEA